MTHLEKIESVFSNKEVFHCRKFIAEDNLSCTIVTVKDIFHDRYTPTLVFKFDTNSGRLDSFDTD